MPESVADQIEREALRQPFPAVEQMIDERRCRTIRRRRVAARAEHAAT